VNHEYEQNQSSSPAAAATHNFAIEPGRSSRSVLLRKPEHAIASGLVQRKGRDGSSLNMDAELLPDHDALSGAQHHAVQLYGTVSHKKPGQEAPQMSATVGLAALQMKAVMNQAQTTFMALQPRESQGSLPPCPF
jgi:hypothetical protein